MASRSIRPPYRWSLFLVFILAAEGAFADLAYRDLASDGWLGQKREVPGVGKSCLVAVAHPQREAAPLKFAGKEILPAGEYSLRLTLRPSHTCDEIAWSGGLIVEINGKEAARMGAVYFARVNQPETRTIVFVHAKPGPLQLALTPFVDHGVFEQASTVANLKAGAGPEISADIDKNDVDGFDEALELEFVPTPKTSFYHVLDRAELVRLSASVVVDKVRIDKIRYDRGEKLAGVADVRNVGAAPADGRLEIMLEHGVNTREKVYEAPISLGRNASQSVSFEIRLPDRELGHACVAGYVSSDGKDSSEKAEYFNIADNFYRVAIHGGFGGRGFTYRGSDAIRAEFADVHSRYANCFEMFAWAEEDMVEMSPDTEYWFSGQTCYHLRKKGLQEYIRAAHERGVSAITYGKFIMSGYLGWKTAYEYPNDHKSQYFFPVGMWEGANTRILDRFKYKEFVPYETGPQLAKNDVFDVWWQNFIPINPDHTPRMVRVAAEEMIRSIEMFGWDAVRWDGHPRGGGQCGGQGQYDYSAARKTQALVRYFKDIVNEKHPRFQHGYNYLFVQDKPDPSWGIEDFELDELCRGGGLIMNESIRNSAGKPFEWIAGNIQVEGDLCRERGGLFLGISCDGESDRDQLVESILYFAGGCRPMGLTAQMPLVNRYGTRYSCYTLDETLQRLASPDKVIKPQSKTSLWWQPFVYETRSIDGRSQLVVNLLNIPRDETPRQEGAQRYSSKMNPGTDPVVLRLDLPGNYKAERASLIDPFTLEVTEAQVEANSMSIPSVAVWLVLVVDLVRDADAPTLASLFGPPATFGVARKDVEIVRTEPAVLDVSKSVVEVNKDMSHLFPGGNRTFDEDPAYAGLSFADRNEAILKQRELSQNQADAFIKGWWKGGSLPGDLKLKESPPKFADLAPERNGRFDIYYARGCMDYPMRLYEAFARLPLVHVRESALWGGRTHYGLGDGISWREFTGYDVLVYLDIPHCAIGIENSYALVDYVKAGGAVLFTGGEYAFGKGGYTWTVLDRELLPVTSVKTVDTRYRQEPIPLEVGPDFSDLGVKLDFSKKPVFWSWNEVGIPYGDVKVFLVSGNRPVLVGRQLGKGRAACFLAQHRGKSTDDATAYFDWEGWPVLVEAVLKWLSPDASTVGATATMPKERLKAIEEELTGSELEDIVDGLDAGGGLFAGGAEDGAAKSRELNSSDLQKRITLLRELMKGSGPDISSVLARQLSSVANLPDDLVSEMVLFVGRSPPKDLAAAARQCLSSTEPNIRGNGYQLLAVAGDDSYPIAALSSASAQETDVEMRDRYVALSLAFYTRPNDRLLQEAERRISYWNDEEQRIKTRYTGGKDFSLAAPEQPCLDSESLFGRIGWLAYAARHRPAVYGKQLAREWLMVGQYQDYCERTKSGLWESLRNATPAQKAAVDLKVRRMARFEMLLERMGQAVEPVVLELVAKQPEPVADGFAEAHFLYEGKRCFNLLGPMQVEQTRSILERLTSVKHPFLRDFASARLATTR